MTPHRTPEIDEDSFVPFVSNNSSGEDVVVSGGVNGGVGGGGGEREREPLVSQQRSVSYTDSKEVSYSSVGDDEGSDFLPFVPPDGNYETADEFVDGLREQLEGITDMGDRQRKFMEEAVLFYDDRKTRHTWMTLILQLIAGVLEAISSMSHLHSEKMGLREYVGVDWLRKGMWYPAIGFTMVAHTSDSLEATDRLVLKTKDHREFWDQIVGWTPKILITLAAVFIVFSATIGEANKTWRENAGEVVALQLFWTIYNTLIHLPMKLWGAVDFLNVFVNKLVYKHILGTSKATPEQVELLASWIENMSEEDLLSGIAFDRSRWPVKEKLPKSTEVMWQCITAFAWILSGVLLFFSTIEKTESSQEGLEEFLGYYGSIIIAVVGQFSAVSLSAKWPYSTIMKPFELLKSKNRSGDWLRVHYPRAYAGLYYSFLFMCSFACFSSFYSASTVLELPSWLQWSESTFIFLFGIHYVLYAACAGFDFTCRSAQYLLEMYFFDNSRIRTLRQATKSSLVEFALVDDFVWMEGGFDPLKKGLLN